MLSMVRKIQSVRNVMQRKAAGTTGCVESNYARSVVSHFKRVNMGQMGKNEQKYTPNIIILVKILH